MKSQRVSGLSLHNKAVCLFAASGLKTSQKSLAPTFMRRQANSKESFCLQGSKVRRVLQRTSFREWGVTDVPGWLRRRTVLKPDLKRAYIDPTSTWWVGSQELLQVFGVKSQG